MGKTNVDSERQIELLEERVRELGSERRSLLAAMEMAVNLSNFETSLNKIENHEIILKATAAKLRQAISFQAVSFYLVREEDSIFYQAYCDPLAASQFLEKEMAILIDDRTFALALRGNKPMFLNASDRSGQIMLHPLATSSRTRGMFAGVLSPRRQDISDVSLLLFSVILVSTADALESFELYRQIKNASEELAQANKQLKEDIARRIRAETAWKQAEEKYRSIFENAVEGIFQIGPDGCLISANPALAVIHGYDTPAELIMHVPRVSAKLFADRDRYNQLIHMLVSESTVENFELQMYRKDGSIIWISVSVRAVKDSSGLLLCHEGFLMDITEKKMLEAQLFQAQKMEAIGRLAGGIAHDFNNILTGIIGYGELLEMSMKEGDPLRQHVEQIVKFANNATSLTKGLLAFSRKQIIRPKPVSMNKIIEGSRGLISRLVGANIELSLILAEKELTIIADTTQIEQVLMNLVINAKDAMLEGGVLTISTETAFMDRHFIETHGYGTEGNYVVLSVADQGIGMNEETRQKIFEPFFTTKTVGKGTGLGLPIVYGIVQQHNGYINCVSEPGQGSVFYVYLPLVNIKPEAEEANRTVLPSQKGGQETILVAEDDIDVRNLIRNVLEGAGYRVLEAVDGEEAVRVWLQHKDQIRLLILDVVMPKKNGREVLDELESSGLKAKALFMSGYTRDIINKNNVIDPDIHFLAKPLYPGELLKTVRNILDQ